MHKSASPPGTRSEANSAISPRAAVLKHPQSDAISVCDEPTHDLGSFWVGPQIEHAFVFRNVGADVGWIQFYRAFSGTEPGCRVRLAPGDETAYLFTGDSHRFHGNFHKKINVKMLPPTDRVCGRSPLEYDDEKHLTTCGPMSRPPLENRWCVRDATER